MLLHLRGEFSMSSCLRSLSGRCAAAQAKSISSDFSRQAPCTKRGTENPASRRLSKFSNALISRAWTPMAATGVCSGNIAL
jgi:hypothetical protein